MVFVNYINEHKAFIEFSKNNKLSMAARLVWYALMHIFCIRSNGNNWVDDYIVIGNKEILAYLDPMSEDTMMRARKELVTQGRIQYQKGYKNKKNPKYKMLYFGNENYPNNAGNVSGKVPGKPVYKEPNKATSKAAGKTTDNEHSNTGSIYKNSNKNYDKNCNHDMVSYDEDDDICACEEEDDDPIVDRKLRTAKINNAFVSNFGRRAYPKEIDCLVTVSHILGFSPEMIERAIEITAEEGAIKPVQYIQVILNRWKDDHVMQVGQIDAYRASNDICRGKEFSYVHKSGDILSDSRQQDTDRDARRLENIAAGIEKE